MLTVNDSSGIIVNGNSAKMKPIELNKKLDIKKISDIVFPHISIFPFER